MQTQPNIFDKLDFIHGSLTSSRMKDFIIETDEEINEIYRFYNAKTTDCILQDTDTILLFAGYFYQMQQDTPKMLQYYQKILEKPLVSCVTAKKTTLLNCIEYSTKEATQQESLVEKYKMMMEEIHQYEYTEQETFQRTIEKHISEINDSPLLEMQNSLIDFYNEIINLPDYSRTMKDESIQRLANLYSHLRETDNMISILKLGISKRNIDSLIKLTQYYIRVGEYQNIEPLKHDYVMSICNGYMNRIIELSDEFIFTMLAQYYSKTGKKRRVVKFYNLAVEKDHEPAMLYLATYYLHTEKNAEKYVEYLLLAIERKKSSIAMNELGIYYLEQSKTPIEETHHSKYIQFYNDRLRDYSLAYSYLMMAYTYDYENAHLLGDVFHFKGDGENTLKYYLIALDYEDNNFANEYACLKLVDYFFEKKEDKTAMNYLLLAVKMNSSIALHKMKRIYIKNNELSKFIDFLYDEIVEENNVFIRNQYKKTTLLFESRKKYSEIDMCSICYEIKKIVPYDCFCHMFCFACYLRIDKCALCKFEKHANNKNREL